MQFKWHEQTAVKWWDGARSAIVLFRQAVNTPLIGLRRLTEKLRKMGRPYRDPSGSVSILGGMWSDIDSQPILHLLELLHKLFTR